jgi:ornithine cyclodeaminase/alanine dehydrogenase-like protein (mu-crystallin family)
MSGRRMLVLSEADVGAVLPMSDVIDAVDLALRAQADDKIVQPVRVAVRTSAGWFGSMPCSIDGSGLGAKLVTFFPDNAKRGLHTHNAVIGVFDPDTGAPSALLDGRLITEMRTAATSAIATRALAVEGASVAAMIGTGVQARSHVVALQTIGMLRELRVWGRTAENANALAAWATSLGVKTSVCATIADACRGSQVVCTVTPSMIPIVEESDVGPGTHINAVGGSTATMQELAPALVGRARLFVDTIDGAMRESGDILRAIEAGTLPKEPDLVRLCDVVSGGATGRSSRDELTVFKSLGMAIEDVACAAMAVERARQRKIGAEVAV